MNDFSHTKACATCGKQFEATYLWAYRRNTKWFHTYSCMTQYDKMLILKKEESRARQSLKQKEIYRKKHELQTNNC